MKIRSAALAALMTLSTATPALAWDPERTSDGGPVAAPSEPAADPEPFIAPPPGIYYVTDTYVADVVTTDGPLTTYSTETVHESTGSYARVLGSVGTGDESVFDGTSFNGRTRLSDGRPVAGTYYENYVLTDDGFVPVSVVFFQDDAELARQRQRSEPSAAAPPGLAPDDTTTVAAPSTECCATWTPGPPTGGSRGDLRDDGPRELRDGPGPQIRPGISARPIGVPLTRFEVLRGRPIELWFHAFAEGREIPVRSWAFMSGEAGDAAALAGSGATPFRSAWDHLAPQGAAYDLRFRLVVAAPDAAVIDAPVSIVVRSPALAE
jgi:hypothetical protein